MRIPIFLLLLVGHGYALCSSEDPEFPYKYYSWTTLYKTIAGNVSLENRPPAECKPVHMVLVARHASRYPENFYAPFFDVLEDLSKNLNTTGNAKLCAEDMQKIQAWTKWFNFDDGGDISPIGVDELRGMGRNFAAYLPEIFENAASQAHKFRFLGTVIERTNQSAQAFAEGFFRDNNLAKVPVETRDRLLRIWPHCPKYILEIDQNETVYEERRKFDEEYMTKVAENYADHLGLPRDQVDLDHIYDVIIIGCAYQEWSTGIPSPWCLAFSTDDLKAYEYAQDIRAYMTDSYGHEINYKQACELKYFVLSALKNASMEENPSYLGHFGFTHSSATIMLMTALNVIEDGGILRSDDYKANANRPFRISFTGTGSGNVAIVLYKCGASETMKIQTFVNEHLVKMPPNDPKDLWDLDDALEYYKFDEGMCDFDELCRVDSGTTTPTNPISTTSEASTVRANVGHIFLFSLAMTFFRI